MKNKKDLLEACKYLISFIPTWAENVPEGLDPTFYGTLSYEGDLKVNRQVNKIKTLIKNKELNENN